MASLSGDGDGPEGSGSTRCILLLQRVLAIQLTRGTSCQIVNSGQRTDYLQQHPADEMWMYDKGYNLFQSFLEANSKCWWNVALVDATRQLLYKGHVAPGVLMVGGPPCALEVLRAAWSRNVLRPPADHTISCLGDIDDCLVAPVAQGQFTPLPEALCWAILELTTQRQAATLDTLRSALKNAFPTMQRPNRELVYDALAKLMQERKIYHTSQGYFVVTPETKRLGRDSGHLRRNSKQASTTCSSSNSRNQGRMLMSNDEAMALVHGEMITLRDGDVTHQAVQTNLADVICGGNPNDKVLFARCRSVPSRLERRHSLRLWGSARRLHRSGSSRSLPRRPDQSDTSSSAEYASTDSTAHSPTKKIGLLSRLFRRSTRRKGTTPIMGTFSAQYPPTEWFNPRVVHLHSVATQTRAASPSMLEGLDQSQASFQVWDDSSSVRSATLPRRHRRQPSGDSTSLLANSTPRSSRRHRSPCSTLPRSKCSSLSRCASGTSVHPSSNNQKQQPQQQKVESQQTLENVTEKSKSLSNSSPNRIGSSFGSTRATTKSANVGTLGTKPTRTWSRRPSQDFSSCSSKSLNTSPQHKTIQKTCSSHSTKSSDKSCSKGKVDSSVSPIKISSFTSSSPIKLIQQSNLTPLQETQNSITLQVSTNLSPATTPQESRTVQSSVTLASNAISSTTISGSPGTKIYLHQNNSPIRSVVTFENTLAKPNSEKDANTKPDKETEDDKLTKKTCKSDDERQSIKMSRPSSLYAMKATSLESDKENKPKIDQESNLKLTNRLNNSQHQIDSTFINMNKNSPLNFHEATMHTLKNTNDAMNNFKKLSLDLSKDASSYKNLLRPGSKKNISSNPPSPTKSFDGLGGSVNNVFIENLESSKQHAAPLGSEPNLEKSPSRANLYSYPSLGDMQVQFKSLAAQKILKGCPINSVDTLVEVNMAANEKQNNCDVTVHTDFGVI